jgi:signal transduction histidine kinase
LEKVRAANKLGMGLLGIQSRIDYLNGSLSTSDETKLGTKYNIRIPILS